MRVSSWAMIAFYMVTYLAVFAHGQMTKIGDECVHQNTCAACIRVLNCVWCDATVHERREKSLQRCVNQQHATPEWCSEENQVNHATNVRFIKNLSLSSGSGGVPIQIQPQVVSLKLRRGEEYHLKVLYRQAKDYPVDLYFLVDFSRSMRRFIDDLAALTDRIVTAIENISSNVQLGFGSFVDKNERPMIISRINRGWPDHYTFINHLRLTNEYKQFRETVNRTPVIDTVDYPEGGFEAMMQAIVCGDKIGWRSDARHLLVHVSDDTPHIAGDGRLAGIVEPNDEKCHLTESGYYDHGELQDYPSLGQINFQARENNINIIFVAISKYIKMYEEIQHVIQNSAVGTFDKKSDDIVKLISGQYEKLVRLLKMTSDSTSKFLDVNFFSKCLDENGKLEPTDQCDGIRVNLTVEFDVVIEAVECPENKEDWHQIIQIKPEGINEAVTVNVDLICDCDCSTTTDERKNADRAEQCNNHGVLECGVCLCDKGHFGDSCDCAGDENSFETNEFMDACRMDNSSEICSNQGTCMCGICSCHDRQFYGKFCQCDDWFCPYSHGQLCGGHGHCKCGECTCHSGWSGPACECPDGTSLCRSPGDDTKICSGHGKCECGRCKCDEGKMRNGRFCEDCPSCSSQRCDEFKDCVECRIHTSGKTYAIDPYCSNCTAKIFGVDEVEVDPDKIKPGEHVCYSTGDDGSTFIFKYVYENGEDKDPTIHAEREKKYRFIGNFLAGTLGVILLTLLLGLLILLMWKIVTHFHDKREFENFEQDRTQVHWAQGQNPLYRRAVTTFRNPIFDFTLVDEDMQTLRE